MTCDPKNLPCTAQCDERTCGRHRPADLSFEEGKYVVVQDGRGRAEVLRHGQPWRDLTGDKFVGCLLSEIEDWRERMGPIQRANHDKARAMVLRLRRRGD